MLNSENALTNWFLLVNLIIFAVIFDWSEFASFISNDENSCRPVLSKVSFGTNCYGGSSSGIELMLSAILIIFIAVFLLVFFLPSYLLTAAAMVLIQSDYPHWCAETFDLISVPVFAVFNAIYWIFLSRFFELIYDYHCENRTVQKNPLSIFKK